MTKEVLHTGFDGLDLALKANISSELHQALETARRVAEENDRDTPLDVNGVSVKVASTGAKGGYRYRIDTGDDGAVWFLKKPNAVDPWGVRLSMKSRALALHGLDGVRMALKDTCARFGLQVPADGVSISRVDYAVDVLDPGFVLEPSAFVIPAHTVRKTHQTRQKDLTDISTAGKSDRYTSVTIGMMPGRQVIVYDKREEVLVKHKVEWPLIWNANRAKRGLPPLDYADPDTSRVWRFELRAGKTCLKDRYGIRGFQSLQEKLPGLLDDLMQDARLTVPTADSNRARWPLHPLWAQLQQVVPETLFQHFSTVPIERVREADLEEKKAEARAAAAAAALRLAIFEGVREDRIPEFIKGIGADLHASVENYPKPLRKRLEEIRERYRPLV
jgi:hypothetical protein